MVALSSDVEFEGVNEVGVSELIGSDSPGNVLPGFDLVFKVSERMSVQTVL
jgi:hypothetical protein